MNRAVINFLPNTQNLSDVINEVRINPSLIYEVLGNNENTANHETEILTIETKIDIPEVIAENFTQALNMVKSKNNSINFFEYQSLTYPTLSKEEFLKLSFDNQKNFVNSLFNFLNTSKVEVHKLAVWSLASLITMGASATPEIIDPGFFDVNYFDNRQTENSEIEILTFENHENDINTQYNPNLEIFSNDETYEEPDSLFFDGLTDETNIKTPGFTSDQIELAEDIEIDTDYFNNDNFDNQIDDIADNDLFNDLDLI